MAKRYTLEYGELISDPFAKLALEALVAKLNGEVDASKAESSLDTPTADDGSGPIRWLRGGWLLNPDGNVKGGAVLRPPEITANQSFYAPDGIDDAVILELESSAAVTITRLKTKTRQSRLLFIVNHGSFTITLAHTTAAADPGQAYPFELASAEDYSLLAEQAVLLYQNPGSEAWNAVSYSAPPELSGGAAGFTYDGSNWWAGRADGLNTTYVGVGHAAPTLEGTPTSNNQSDSTYNLYTSLALAGSAAGVRLQGTVGCQLRHNPTFVAKVMTGASVSAIRIWIGLTFTAPTNADNEGGVTQYVMFRYSTVAGDGGWVGVTRDGTTQSVTGTVAAIATSTKYSLKIRVADAGATVYFSVNGGTEVAKTTNLPTGTTNLGFAIIAITTDGAAQTISISRHFCEFGT